MLGTNDANPLMNDVDLDKDEYFKDYRAFIKTLKVLPSSPEIRLITSPPLYKEYGGID